MIKYSIIIPCYNLEKYIYKSIQSVLDQTYDNYEIIIINDGSTDKSLEVLEKIQSESTKIKIINQSNGGVSKARNKGIKNSTGDYIIFLDGDDFQDEKLLYKASELISKTHCDMFSFGYKLVEDSTYKLIKDYSTPIHHNRTFSGVKFLQLFLEKKINQHMCSFIVKKQIIDENFISFNENTAYGEDHEFQMTCMLSSKKIVYDKENYFIYVKRENSAINSHFNTRRFETIMAALRFRKLIQNNKILIDKLDNFVCYKFLVLYNICLKNKASIEQVDELFKYDYIFKRFKISFNKYDLIMLAFKISYTLYIKPTHKRKLKLIK